MPGHRFALLSSVVKRTQGTLHTLYHESEKLSQNKNKTYRHLQKFDGVILCLLGMVTKPLVLHFFMVLFFNSFIEVWVMVMTSHEHECEGVHVKPKPDPSPQHH